MLINIKLTSIQAQLTSFFRFKKLILLILLFLFNKLKYFFQILNLLCIWIVKLFVVLFFFYLQNINKNSFFIYIFAKVIFLIDFFEENHL
jgi:hypothetical protein